MMDPRMNGTETARVVKIRPHLPHDYESLALMWRLFMNELRPEGNPDTEAFLAMLRELDEHESQLIIVAEDSEGGLVGFLHGLVMYDPGFAMIQLHVQYAWVAHHYRGVHVGATMAEEMAKIAKAKGVEQVVAGGEWGPKMMKNLCKNLCHHITSIRGTL